MADVAVHQEVGRGFLGTFQERLSVSSREVVGVRLGKTSMLTLARSFNSAVIRQDQI
jgi:hypothetical protein